MNTFIESLKCKKCGNNPNVLSMKLRPLCKEHGDTIVVVRRYLAGSKKGVTK